MRQFHILTLMVLLLAGGAIGRVNPVKQPAGQNEQYLALRKESQGLRTAIKDLMSTFGDCYPKGKKYLIKLEAIERRMNKAAPTEIKTIEAEFAGLQRKALIANPLVSGQPILFIVRRQYKKDHHNTATMFKTGEINTSSFDGGGAMKTIDLAKGGRLRTLFESDEGLVRDPEVHFDGKKIVFSMRRNIRDDYHIYEINTDGTGKN